MKQPTRGFAVLNAEGVAFQFTSPILKSSSAGVRLPHACAVLSECREMVRGNKVGFQPCDEGLGKGRRSLLCSLPTRSLLATLRRGAERA